MKIKKSPQYKAFQVLNTVILLCLTIATLYPVYYIAIASVSDSNELIKHMGLLFKPLGLNFQAYLRVFQNQMIVSGYLNTFKILILGLSINMCLTILGAYVLSRKDLPGRRFMMLIIIFTMYFSGGLIPASLTSGDPSMLEKWAKEWQREKNNYNIKEIRIVTNRQWGPNAREGKCSFEKFVTTVLPQLRLDYNYQAESTEENAAIVD